MFFKMKVCVTPFSLYSFTFIYILMYVQYLTNIIVFDLFFYKLYCEIKIDIFI